MAMPKEELKRVFARVGELYDEMVRTVYGDRVTLAVAAAGLGGLGLGLILHDKWGARMTGAFCYATAAGLELYAAMTPKREEQRATAGTRPESRAA